MTHVRKSSCGAGGFYSPGLVPCCSSVTPINFNPQDNLAGRASPRATLRQVPRFPADMLSVPSAWPAVLPLSSVSMLDRSLKMLENISQLKSMGSFWSALSWTPARALPKPASLSPWGLLPGALKVSVQWARERCFWIHQNQG